MASEECVARALKWLASHQMPDGGWSFDLTICPSCHGQCSRFRRGATDLRNAATGLALLPLPRQRTRRTRESGDPRGRDQRRPVVPGQSYAYGPARRCLERARAAICIRTGIAAIALVRSLRHDARPQPLAARPASALTFIASAQLQGRRLADRITTRKATRRCSVAELMALKSGPWPILPSREPSSRRAHRCSSTACRQDAGRQPACYGYQTPDKGSDATAAIGLLCRMYLGWKQDDPALRRGAFQLISPSKLYGLRRLPQNHRLQVEVRRFLRLARVLAWGEDTADYSARRSPPAGQQRAAHRGTGHDDSHGHSLAVGAVFW